MDLSEVPSASFRRHPWEVARARFFRRVLDDAGLLAARLAVLDVGAGDGYLARALLEVLPPASSVVCFDANYGNADIARFVAPPRQGLSFSRQRPAERFDLLLLLDVIEHVADDRAFLTSLLAQNLVPGGQVLISVPAWPVLISRHDQALKHYRRYSPAACRKLLAAVGLCICKSGGVFHSLLLPRALGVAGERLLGRLGREPSRPAHIGEWRHGPVLSALLTRALAVDNALSHLFARFDRALPGLSFWALCGAPANGSRKRTT